MRLASLRVLLAFVLFLPSLVLWVLLTAAQANAATVRVEAESTACTGGTVGSFSTYSGAKYRAIDSPAGSTMVCSLTLDADSAVRMHGLIPTTSYDVAVDGGTPVRVTIPSGGTTQPQGLIYTTPALAAGAHTLSIKHVSGNGRVDFLEYVGPDAPAPTTPAPTTPAPTTPPPATTEPTTPPPATTEPTTPPPATTEPTTPPPATPTPTASATPYVAADPAAACGLGGSSPACIVELGSASVSIVHGGLVLLVLLNAGMFVAALRSR